MCHALKNYSTNPSLRSVQPHTQLSVGSIFIDHHKLPIFTYSNLTKTVSVEQSQNSVTCGRMLSSELAWGVALKDSPRLLDLH